MAEKLKAIKTENQSLRYELEYVKNYVNRQETKEPKREAGNSKN